MKGTGSECAEESGLLASWSGLDKGKKAALGGEELGEGSDARGVNGEDKGEVWGEAGRELCFIADLSTTIGAGRSFPRESGSDLGLNIGDDSELDDFAVAVVVGKAVTINSSSDHFPWLLTMTNSDDEQKDKETSKEEYNNESNSSEQTTQPAEANETAVSSKPDADDQPLAASGPTPWQAIFSPQYNAYYFYNTETHQTTWENPLLPAASSSTINPAESTTDPSFNPNDPTTDTSGQYAALQAAAIAAGIDPSLAHLDPSLLASIPSSSTNPSSLNAGLPPSFTAKFNARTGQFTRPDGRDPSHLSEHARMTRMSEFYFDVKGWEEELAQRGGSLMGNEEETAEGGKKRKRPTKKDLVGVLFFLI